MTLRKGILIAVVVTVLAITALLLPALHWTSMGMNIDMDNIRFYGHIIDQHDQPVVDALIKYELGGSALGGYGGVAYTRSDAHGNFSIVGKKGSFLGIDGVTAPDIEFGFPIPENSLTTWSDSKIKSKTFYGFQPQKGDHEALWTDTSPENPYVFRAWRIGGEVEESAKNLKIGEAIPSFEYGKTYTLNLLKPRREISKEGESDGQLRVIFHREADAEDVTQRWEARIIPVNGGIQATKDPYMNMAPEAGYEPELSIVREKFDNEKIDGLSNQQFYFKANNGQVYGSLFVAFEAKAYGKMMMFINYKINPDGGRILVKAPVEPH